MSAYVESNWHFDVLASWATRFKGANNGGAFSYSFAEQRITPSAESLATLLHGQNVRSVCHRYNDQTPSMYAYRFRTADTSVFSAADILMACRGLEYQSCETPDYRETEAFAALDAIRKRAINEITDGSECWSIDAETIAKRTRRPAIA